MTMLSLRLPDDLSEMLGALAKATGRSKSFHAVEALREYLAREAWQVAQIEKALKEADAGDFASEAEVSAVMEKWLNNAG